MQNQKQEPHTKLWGKNNNTNINSTTGSTSSSTNCTATSTSTTTATITTITSSLHHLSASPSPSSALPPPPQPQPQPQRQRQPRQETRYVMRFRKRTSSSQKFRNKLSCKILEDTWGIWDPAVVWRSVCIWKTTGGRKRGKNYPKCWHATR